MPDTSPCTVARKCSSTGRACGPDDRPCQDQARSGGLEVVCERPEPREWIYCPPGAQQRDSGVVWVLLAVAMGVAVMGAIVSVLVFRRRLTGER